MQKNFDEYKSRRDFLIERLNNIPGVYSPMPQGAFYTLAKLPIDDADAFCAWCLSDFQYEGQTVFMAPATGFYVTPGLGKNEVRIAYVLNKEDLEKALTVLEKHWRHTKIPDNIYECGAVHSETDIQRRQEERQACLVTCHKDSHCGHSAGTGSDDCIGLHYSRLQKKRFAPR